MEKKTKILAVLFLALMLCMSSCSGCSGCDKIKKIIGVLTDQETTESASESGSETEDESSASDEETDESSDVASGNESDKESSKKESGSKKENDGISATGGSKEKSEEESSEETEKESSEETTKESASESSSETEKASETAHTHTFKHVAKVDPTCEKDGNIEYWQCTECYMCFKDAEGKNYISKPEDLVLKGGHKLTFHKGYAPNICGVDNISGYYGCETCGKKFYDEEGKNPVLNDADLTVPNPHELVLQPFCYATCMEDGQKEHYKCKKCGALFWDKDAEMPVGDPTEVVLVSPKAHDLVFIPLQMGDCVFDGHWDHYECSECGALFWDANGENPISDPNDVVMKGEHDTSGAKIPTFTGPCGSVTEHWICPICGEWIDTVYYSAHPEAYFYGSGYDSTALHTWKQVEDSEKKPIPNPDGPGYLYECPKCHQRCYMDPKG